MRLRRRVRQETFTRAKRDKALTLETTISSTHVSVPRRDPNIPRTEKESDALVVNTFTPAMHVFSLRTKGNKWRSLKSNPAWPSAKDWDNTTRTYWLKIIIGTGSTPSAFVEMIWGIPSRLTGQFRRYHNPNWRDQTNQYIRRAHSFNRVQFQR
jgi:hypothetical protein